MTATATVLAIDPGVDWHGWCVLELLDGALWAPVRWGHDRAARVELEIRSSSSSSSLVAIETPAGDAYSAARVRGLLAAAVAAGEFRGVARAAGARVVSCSAETWRAALTGRASPDDDTIATALERQRLAGCLVSLPATKRKEELSHVLDACGLAFVTGRRGAEWVEAREAERQSRASRQTTLPGLGSKRGARK